MLVKDVMTPKRKLISIQPTTTAREVLKLMRTHSVHSVIVEKTHTGGALWLSHF